MSAVRFISICTQTQSKVTRPKTNNKPTHIEDFVVAETRGEVKLALALLQVHLSGPVGENKQTKEDAAYAHAH